MSLWQMPANSIAMATSSSRSSRRSMVVASKGALGLGALRARVEGKFGLLADRTGEVARSTIPDGRRGLRASLPDADGRRLPLLGTRRSLGSKLTADGRP